MSKCFIIMSFGGKYDTKTFETVLKPATVEAGYTPVRGDSTHGSSYILADIWRSIQESVAVIALLAEEDTEPCPKPCYNLYYELGLAHAILKPAILVAKKSHKIPSNLSGVRAILYDE